MPANPELFFWLKATHLTTAFLSISGFVLRSVWMWRGSPLLKAPLTRILPHVNDTILLASALGCAVLIQQYPFRNAWLTAKLLALLLYIVAGAIALTYGKTARARKTACAIALASVVYIVLVAFTKNPLPL